MRETLRLHSPATFTLRTALADDALPVSAPFRGRDGALHAEIGIKRGDRVVVPILALHRSPALWGADALEFRYVSFSFSFTLTPGGRGGRRQGCRFNVSDV